MASNTCTHCAPPLFSVAHHRSPVVFMSRAYSFRPLYSSRPPTLRIVSVHSNKPCSGKSVITTETDSPTTSSIDFLTLCHRLKTTKRKGWINHGIKGPESVADHMFRMALMALIASDLPGVNRERCIKIAIVHDIAEAIVGDITPSCAEEIQELWAEYENNASLEANLVKDFDKVELILQALEYEMELGKVLDEIFLSTEGKFRDWQKLGQRDKFKEKITIDRQDKTFKLTKWISIEYSIHSPNLLHQDTQHANQGLGTWRWKGKHNLAGNMCLC
ncbi:hypothetical protein F3Y22_tig00111799pilonHSYRG00052 [Hibiscus syriacus]|uniref:5'-deoxynucleotidase n=1 Tax=Hibiscus syriacus TaxID=106335 RepID=A0A6A2XD66_HIBSY|nr:hypothetical protein F3Y22_tig00111799pilonHSYRG00052 [Hibiscus syriacus]